MIQLQNCYCYKPEQYKRFPIILSGYQAPQGDIKETPLQMAQYSFCFYNIVSNCIIYILHLIVFNVFSILYLMSLDQTRKITALRGAVFGPSFVCFVLDILGHNLFSFCVESFYLQSFQEVFLVFRLEICSELCSEMGLEICSKINYKSVHTITNWPNTY